MYKGILVKEEDSMDPAELSILEYTRKLASKKLNSRRLEYEREEMENREDEQYECNR